MDIWLSSSRSVRIVLDIAEWIIIIGIGLLLPFPSIPPLLILKVFGVVPIFIGLWIHKSAHSLHKQVHEPKEKVERLVTSGIYSKIRHPCYLEIMLYYLGVLLIIGSLSMLIPIVLFVYILYDSAVKEEKFGKDYEEYMKKVRWRFIPYIF